MKLLLFFVLSVFVSGYFAQENIAGIWTDSRKGGSFYICTGNSSANGLYSEFGLAIGTVEEDGKAVVWEGKFYEGGLGDCLSGDFRLSFTSNSYNGVYTCHNNDSVEFPWDGTLEQRRENNTARECGTVIDSNDSNSIVGKWGFETADGLYQVDLCIEDDDSEDFDDHDDSDSNFQASYFRPNHYIPLGYDTGYTARTNTIGVGSFYRSNDDGALPGTALWFVNSKGGLSYIWWAGHYEYLNLDLISDTDIHGYETYTSRSGTSEEECSRFAPIAAEPYDYYPYGYELFYFRETSSASALVGSVLLSLFVFLL